MVSGALTSSAAHCAMQRASAVSSEGVRNEPIDCASCHAPMCVFVYVRRIENGLFGAAASHSSVKSGRFDALTQWEITDGLPTRCGGRQPLNINSHRSSRSRRGARHRGCMIFNRYQLEIEIPLYLRDILSSRLPSTLMKGHVIYRALCTIYRMSCT